MVIDKEHTVKVRQIMGILTTIAALFGSSCTKHDVHVEFIHGKDNTSIGVVDLPLKKLPDTDLSSILCKWVFGFIEPAFFLQRVS